MPLRQTALRVPEDELERAKKLADAKGISLSEFLRRALAVQLACRRPTSAVWRPAANRSAAGASRATTASRPVTALGILVERCTRLLNG